LALEDTVIGSLIGVVGGFLLGLYTQNWNIKRSTHESTKERVYSPLFDEIEESLERLKQNNPLTTSQWLKITRELHLSYLIEPAKLYEKLRKFYDETDHNLSRQIQGCSTVYHDFVKQDLMEKVTSAAAIVKDETPTTLNAIEEVSRGVGYCLHKSALWFGDLPHFNHEYDRLKPYATGLEATFQEYFDAWRKKSHDDKEMVDYRRIHLHATNEATDLRKLLAKKLGKKL